MMNLKKQRGASFVFWVIIAALFGFLLMMGVKLFPVYYRGLSVKQLVVDVSSELNQKNPNRAQVWDKLYKRLDVNGIANVKKEHMVFVKEKNQIVIGLSYEECIPLVGNIDALVTFDYRQALASK